MDVWAMVVLTAAAVLAPIVLLAVFHGSDAVDARGHRLSSRWRTHTRHLHLPILRDRRLSRSD